MHEGEHCLKPKFLLLSAPASWLLQRAEAEGSVKGERLLPVHPRQHLKTFKGALQADAYAGFHHLYGEDIYEAACWAHYLESGVIWSDRGIVLGACC